MDTRLQDNLKGMQHNYIAPFLWLHNEDDNLILDELQRIYDCGIRSVCLESRVHEEFAREDWWSDMRLIMDWCRKRDMKVWILDDKHYPSGYANGLFEEQYKDYQAWGLGEYHIDIAGPVFDGCAMADCWKEEEEDEIVAILACRHVPESEDYDEIIDITEGLHGGMVYFSLPEGMWRIIFLVKTRGGISQRRRPFCDMLNPESIEVFIREVYDSHYKHLKEYFGNTLLGFFSDEPSFKNNSNFSFACDMGEAYYHHPWSERVMDLLKERFGNITSSLLAGLWYNIGEGRSEEIRFAYMDIISQEYQDNFTKRIADWCHSHGVEYIGHIIEDNNAHAKTGAGPGHYFRALSGQDMAGIDVVLHQIIPGLTECNNAGNVVYKHMNSKFFHYYLAKLASSMAHQNPQTQGRAMCEIFGAFGWAEGTKLMKYLTDHMLVRGINYYVPHAFSPKKDDTDCPPNFYNSGKNAQYKYFDLLMAYMNRMCYALSDGIHMPAAAILYDAEAIWINKARVPLEEVGKVLYDNLLDYDILSADMLEQVDTNGCINGEHYPYLLVPCYEGIPEKILEKLRKTHTKVLFVTKKNVIDEKADCCLGFETVEINQLAAYLRGCSNVDVTADYEGIYLRYYHYKRNGAHLYLFSNEDIHHTIKTKITISAFNGGKYILYDAFENKACSYYSDSSEIELELPQYHTVLLLCGDVSYDGVSNGCNSRLVKEIQINPEFRISYASEQDDEFIFYKNTKKLFNISAWNELPDFSGNIKYECKFKVDMEAGGIASQQWTIDLGQVGEAAEVLINDVSVGKKITPPYVFDVTDAMHNGLNALTVIVSNHSGYKMRDVFSKFLLFEASGLLGPIILKSWEQEEEHEFSN